MWSQTYKNFLLLVFLCVAYLKVAALDASINYCTFSAGERNYVEVYFHIKGNTVAFEKLDSFYSQGKVEVVIFFMSDNRIVNYDKFLLSSPPSIQPIDFIDLKRYALENGLYTLEVEVHDVADTTNTTSLTVELKMDYEPEVLGLSDIQLLSSYSKATEDNPFVKNGYYLEPLAFNFVDRHSSSLIFYTEVYNADKAIGEDYLIRYYIESVRGNGDTSQTTIVGNKRKKALPTNVLLMRMDMGQLATGNYNLVVEVRNRENELLESKSVFFQRSNPFLNIENIELTSDDVDDTFVQELDEQQLRYSLKAIAMNVKDADVEILNSLIKNKNVTAQRYFLFSYWAETNPNHPDAAYAKYMEVAQKIDEVFQSGFGYGFETDRGYIFMKYGQPDDIIAEETDPSAPPYEIWVYNDFPKTRQTRVKFLFYNPSLATNDYHLLHSNALGEINNPQWQLELYRSAPNEIKDGDYMDGTEMEDGFNRNAARYFNDY